MLDGFIGTETLLPFGPAQTQPRFFPSFRHFPWAGTKFFATASEWVKNSLPLSSTPQFRLSNCPSFLSCPRLPSIPCDTAPLRYSTLDSLAISALLFLVCDMSDRTEEVRFKHICNPYQLWRKGGKRCAGGEWMAVLHARPVNRND